MSTREEILAQVEKDARLNDNFILLVILSAIVAAIGLLENNLAVIVGAMVIAPLLGPNIAFSLYRAFKWLMTKAIPACFDKLIKLLEKASAHTDTKVDDKIVAIQKSAKAEYMAIIKSEFN